MTTRAFGTDALNASSSSPVMFTNPFAGFAAKPQQLHQHTSSSTKRDAQSMLSSFSRKSRAPSTSRMSDKLMGIDRAKPADKSWMRDMDDHSAASKPPVCRNFVQTGHCIYGNDCGFDHPTPITTVSAAMDVEGDEPPALLAPAKPKRITVQLQDKLPEPLGARSLNRREMSPSPAPSHRKSLAQVHTVRRDSSVVRDARRPSLPAVPATVLENRAMPGQPAFLVPAKEHSDAPPAVPVLPPMFYATYRRGSNGEVLDPALIPHGVQAQKSLYYRTKPCRYWSTEGVCPKGDKCTFIHDPSIAPAAAAAAAAPERCVSPPSPVVEEPVVAAAVIVAEPTKKATRPRLPPPVPSKVREPHPAWRVVGGGVTLANAKTEDQMDEDAVEQELLGLPATPQPQPQPIAIQVPVPVAGPSSPVGYEAHNGYPAYALPTHAVYHAYAYPSPVAYQAPATPQPVQYVQAAGPSSPGAYPGTEPAWGGWTMVEGAQPMPYYAVPMYSQPAPAPSATPQPVLYGTTPSAYVYGIPADTRTVDTLADAGVDVSALDGAAPTFLPAGHDEDDSMTDVDELEGYGMQSHAGFDGVDVEVSVGAIGHGMVSNVPQPAEVRRSFSWADEVEEMDPQWSVAPAAAEVDMVDAHAHYEGESGSWPQCATTPNSPRLRARLFSAEA